MEAVKQEGVALRFASIKLRNDREVVKCAIKQNGSALKYASVKLMNDDSIAALALKQNGLALTYVRSGVRFNPKLVLLLLSKADIPSDLVLNYYSVKDNIVWMRLA